MEYITTHWAQISTGVLTAAIFCSAHGGIKGIALSLWRGKPTEPKQPETATVK